MAFNISSTDDYSLLLAQGIAKFAHDYGIQGLPDDLRPCLWRARVGKSKLAIMGSVKTGKSTLINQLIGERLLPSGYLQCSSEIVEIGSAKDYRAEIRFADGHDATEIFASSTALFQRLVRIASVPDRYRSIPHTLIDDLIVRAEGKAVMVDGTMINSLEAESGLSNLAQERKSITEYLDQRTLADIPLRIRIGSPRYPYPDLTLLDSPGSNAVGGLDRRLQSGLADIDGVAVVHSLEEAVETKGLKQAIESAFELAGPMRVALILTKSAAIDSLSQKQKVTEARRLYEERIGPERVFVTDSLLAAVADDVEAAWMHGGDPGYKREILLLKERAEIGDDHLSHELDNRRRLWRDYLDENEEVDDVIARLRKQSGSPLRHLLTSLKLDWVWRRALVHVVTAQRKRSGLPQLKRFLKISTSDWARQHAWEQLTEAHREGIQVESTRFRSGSCPAHSGKDTLMALYADWLGSTSQAYQVIFATEQSYYLTHLKELYKKIAHKCPSWLEAYAFLVRHLLNTGGIRSYTDKRIPCSVPQRQVKNSMTVRWSIFGVAGILALTLLFIGGEEGITPHHKQWPKQESPPSILNYQKSILSTEGKPDESSPRDGARLALVPPPVGTESVPKVDVNLPQLSEISTTPFYPGSAGTGNRTDDISMLQNKNAQNLSPLTTSDRNKTRTPAYRVARPTYATELSHSEEKITSKTLPQPPIILCGFDEDNWTVREVREREFLPSIPNDQKSLPSTQGKPDEGAPRDGVGLALAPPPAGIEWIPKVEVNPTRLPEPSNPPSHSGSTGTGNRTGDVSIPQNKNAQDLFPLTTPGRDKARTPAHGVGRSANATELSHSEVKSAQRYLRSLGYKPGVVDGKFGPRTRSALVQYQRDHQIPVSGDLSRSVFLSLERANEQRSISSAALSKASRDVLHPNRPTRPP